MVKILQAYNFAKQHTYSLNGEILAATIINSNRVAVSSTEQFIEIYDIGGKERRQEFNIGVGETSNNTTEQQQASATSNVTDGSNGGGSNDERQPTKYSLATVGEVVNLIYCESGKYLLTLEKENVASPVHSNSTSISCTSNSNSTTAYSEDDTKMFVRIYANFTKFPESRLADLPITIRIASMTTPKAPLVESIDVIELPLRSPPNLIQCCQTSGNIIVSSKERIYLYEYTQCTHENTQPRFSYIDFLPFKFFVNLNFVPLKLKLAENVIACMNNRYCVAFKVVDVLSNNNASVGGGTAGLVGGTGTCGPVGFASVLFEDDYEDDVVDIDGDEAISSSESSLISKASGGGVGGVGFNGPSSHNSFETDSLETTSSGRIGIGIPGLPGRTPIDFNVARIVNSACGREFEVDLKSQWEQNCSGGGCGGNNDGFHGLNTSTATNAANGGSSSGINDTQDILIAPTRASDIKIKLVNEAKAMNVQRISNNSQLLSPQYDEVQYDIRKLLQICMKTNESSGRVVDILRCIDLKAIYQRTPAEGSDDAEDSEIYEMGNQQIPSAVTSTKHIVRRTLKSNQHHNCIGYALLVASSVDGYLYQFCAQGKWYNENEKPIATYSFTAPVLQVHINDYVIYAITTESVETHTSRIGNKLFNSRFEYPTIGGLFPEESSPDMNAPITVVGLCSFMHIQYACINRNNLILISNSAIGTAAATTADSSGLPVANKRRSGSGGVEVKRNIAARLLAEAKAKHSLLRSGSNSANQQQHTATCEWTLYNLEIPGVEHIAEDLEAIAETYRAASSTNFYDLMEEAHVMLRLSLSLQCEQLGGGREQLLRTRFLENCQKLANFSVRSQKKEIYLQATGFYKMCNMQLLEIYNNYMDNFLRNNVDNVVDEASSKAAKFPTTNTLSTEELIGLIYTVKVFLLSLGTDRLKAAFLNHLVKPFFTPSRVIEQGYPMVPLSLEFLNLFVKYSPADIPQIMLNSPVLADAISGELINYLKYLEKLSPDANLLLAVTACRMSNYLLAQETISKTGRRELALSLIEHKNVLFDDGTVLCRKQHEEYKNGVYLNNTRQMRHIFLPSTSSPSSMSTRRQPKSKFAASTSNATSLSQAQNNGATNAAGIASFSDFTETILLATENPALIEAISDAFVHALCVEQSVTLDMILQLFLNYIASHIGHKGYQTSQKVFANILQVYYYDLLDINALNNSRDIHSTTPIVNENDSIDDAAAAGGGGGSKAGSSSNSERDNESLANSNAESNSCTSISIEDRPPLLANSISYRQRIVYDQLREQQSQSPCKCNSLSQIDESPLHSMNEKNNETNLKGLKILFRMYLGRLKALSDLIVDLQSADVEQQAPPNETFLNLRMECIRFMLRHLQDLRAQQQQQQQDGQQENNRYYYNTAGINARQTLLDEGRKLVFVSFMPNYKLTGEEFQNHVSEYIRPIPCLMERPQYLNRLPPFRRSDFSFPNRDEGECDVHFVGWHNELLTLTLKIQSLLASPRIDREIIEEFIAFIQKTPDLIGIDSFLVIVLPKNLAINYMLSFCPEYMWQYGKSNRFTAKHWESLLRKIVDKQDILPNWKQHLTEILNHLVAELSFEELLQCFPSEVLLNRNTEQIFREFIDNRFTYEHEGIVYEKLKPKQSAGNTTEAVTANTDAAAAAASEEIPRNHLPMDNIDEDNVFELTLRKAVSKQRSIALRSMIESTGTQLFDATSNPMYNL